MVKKTTLIILIFLVGLTVGQAISSPVLVGETSLYIGDSKKENIITLFKSSEGKDVYILKVGRNVLDSRVMGEGVEVGGWLEVPLPLKILPSIKKRYSFKYTHSDTESDYFRLVLI